MTKIVTPKIPAIFFDRDGVLNIDKGYVFKKDDFIWVDGAREALALTCAKGYLAIVVTNQSGIARGFYTLDDMHHLHDWMTQDILGFNARIDGFYFCPYHSEGSVIEYVVPDHPDRKPNPGMLLRAIAEHGIDPATSLMVGDQDSDVTAAERAGVSGLKTTGGRLDDAIAPWLAGLPAQRR